MGYYLSVDGGGTKISAILFDEHYRCIGTGLGGAVNTNFEQTNIVQSNMAQCIDQCLAAAGKTVVLNKIFATIVGPADLFLHVLGKRAEWAETQMMSEGRLSLYAGIQLGEGIVAVAGTGSNVYGIEGTKELSLGGWGSLIGDEGSGYYIGREGIMAALRAYEQRGPETMLRTLIMNEWQLYEMHDVIAKIYQVSSYRTAISSASRIVAKAARAGDEVAMRIFEAAGEEMALQVITLIERNAFAEELPITTAGSVWKGHPVMFERFKSVLEARFPRSRIARPLFEPVVGGVIGKAMEGTDRLEETQLDELKKEYAAFLVHNE